MLTRKENYEVWMPVNCDFSLWEQLLYKRISNIPASPLHCYYHPFSPHGSPSSPLKDKSKGHLGSQHLGHLLLVCRIPFWIPPRRMFMLKAWLWVSEALGSSRTIHLGMVNTFKAIYPVVARSGWGREVWVEERGGSGRVRRQLRHLIPYRCIWAWAVNKGYVTWS